MINEIEDYLDAGFRIFGLHGVDKDGFCDCGSDKCEAIYKHPIMSNWQNVPHWSDDQLEAFEQMGHFDTGFGALCSGWLIVDVDARNGGVGSYQKLLDRIPEISSCGFIVETGSGGGSKHLYFRAPEGCALIQNHNDYPGLDFKSSGFVVCAGSMHASGKKYKAVVGSPFDIGPAPESLINLLKKPDTYRVKSDAGDVDVDEAHIRELLSHIDPDCPYETWVKSGMAVHHCLNGDGFDAWDEWSANGSKYPGSDQLSRHWHSFGKSPNPAGYGTLLHYAREGGYIEDVTFEYTPEAPSKEGDVLDTSSVDLLRPPGWVGELTTGKEAVQQSYLKILRTAGVQAAVHGGFKSEQEMMRNLIRHQAAFYNIDELGLVLRKLENASKRGGASYLEGIVGLIMSVYSKANGYLPITGDLKEEIREHLRKELSTTTKRIDDLPADSSSDGKRAALEQEQARLMEALDKIDDGLDSPYLTILGYTTPVTFDALMGFEQATNGFMARAMIFNDLETNPKRKKGFRKEPMSDQLATSIRNLYAPGAYDMMERGQRVEYRGEKTVVPTTAEAADALNEVYERFHAMADSQKGATGLEAIPRRGYELAAKVSLILALPSGLRTAEHVRWAYALAKRDVEKKIQLAFSTENEEQDNGIAAKVMSLLDRDHGETEGVLLNRLRRHPKEQVRAVLRQLVEKGMLRSEETKASNNKTCIRYYLGVI